MASKKDTSSLEALNSAFHDLYKKDPTLDYLTKFEEDRKQLLGLEQDSSLFQTQAEEMKKILASSITQSAFDTAEDYKKYAMPILSTVDKHDYYALKGLAKVSVSSFLDKGYSSTLKATGLLADSIERANAIGLASTELYSTQLSDSVEQYFNNDKIKASQGILSLASAINSDLFKTKINEHAGLGSMAGLSKTAGLADLNFLASKKAEFASKADFSKTAKLAKFGSFISKPVGLGSMAGLSKAAGLADLNFLASKADFSKTAKLAKFNSIISKPVGLGLASHSLKDTIKTLSSNDIFQPLKLEKISQIPPKDFKHLEIPRVQDSPMYKQNEKLIDKSEKQIEAIKEMSKYLIVLGENQGVQADKLNELNNEFLNNSHKQIELMAEISGFLSYQSEILEVQKENQETQSDKLNELNSELLNNSHEQIKLMAEVSNFLALQSTILEAQKKNQELHNEQLKMQNEKMEEQIKDNKASLKENKISSKRALLIAWAGIGIGVLSAFGGMYLEHYIYMKEDKSDNINHTELKQAINKNNYKNSYKKLMQQVILQNKNQNLTNNFFKTQAIESQKVNQQLLEQLKIQNKNIVMISKRLNKQNLDNKQIVKKGK